MCIIYHILFLHSFVDGQLSYFYFLNIVSNTSINTGIQVSVPVPVLNSFEYVSRSRITESYSHFMLHFLKNHWIVSIVAASL